MIRQKALESSFITNYIIVLIAIVCCNQSLAQSPRNLVFEGAGLRGIAYCGALQKMEEHDWLRTIQRVGGTSSGAVTAMAVSLGYSSGELRQLISGTSFKKLNDGHFMFIGGINRMNKYFGWYRTKRTDEWLGKIIAAKTGNADINFRQLKEQGYKDLYVTGTCLNKPKLIVFSHETYPEMKIRDAVRISMSIPLYFEAAFIDSKGTLFYHPENKKGLDIVVDGGITGNFPIRLFDSTRYMNLTGTKNEFMINKETIGVRLDSDEQVSKDDNYENDLAPLYVNSLKEYISAFYNLVIENLNRQSLGKEDWQRTVSISTGTIAPRIRKIKKEEVSLLINNGVKGFENFRKK